MAVVVVGSFMHDHVWRCASAPKDGETVLGRLSTGPGGKGFNQAIAAHRMGAEALFIGAIGRDRLGDAACAFALAEGLRCQWQTIELEATGSAGIFVDNQAQNRICVDPGANLALTAEFVDDALAGCRPAVVLTQLEIALSIIEQVLRSARRFGALSMLNPAPVPPHLDHRLLALADLLTPNESEFAALCSQTGAELAAADVARLDDPALAALAARLPCATVVLTLGADGAVVVERGRAITRLPAFDVRPVDSTGAGDAFSGALACALARGQPLLDAVRVASAAGALATLASGAAAAMPRRREVLALAALEGAW